MKIRVRKYATGVKGYDCRIVFPVEVKTFIFWKSIREFESLEEAKKFVIGLSDYRQLIFII